MDCLHRTFSWPIDDVAVATVANFMHSSANVICLIGNFFGDSSNLLLPWNRLVDIIFPFFFSVFFSFGVESGTGLTSPEQFFSFLPRFNFDAECGRTSEHGKQDASRLVQWHVFCPLNIVCFLQRYKFSTFRLPSTTENTKCHRFGGKNIWAATTKKNPNLNAKNEKERDRERMR